MMSEVLNASLCLLAAKHILPSTFILQPVILEAMLAPFLRPIVSLFILSVLEHVCDLSGVYGNVEAGSVVDSESAKIHSPSLARMTQVPSPYILSCDTHPCDCLYSHSVTGETPSFALLLGSIMAATLYTARVRHFDAQAP